MRTSSIRLKRQNEIKLYCRAVAVSINPIMHIFYYPIEGANPFGKRSRLFFTVNFVIILPGTLPIFWWLITTFNYAVRIREFESL